MHAASTEEVSAAPGLPESVMVFIPDCLCLGIVATVAKLAVNKDGVTMMLRDLQKTTDWNDHVLVSLVHPDEQFGAGAPLAFPLFFESKQGALFLFHRGHLAAVRGATPEGLVVRRQALQIDLQQALELPICGSIEGRHSTSPPVVPLVTFDILGGFSKLCRQTPEPEATDTWKTAFSTTTMETKIPLTTKHAEEMTQLAISSVRLYKT